MTALPVMKMNFGGLNYELQSGAFQLGRLKCYGDSEVDSGTSCSALKRKGATTSGNMYFDFERKHFTAFVFCVYSLLPLFRLLQHQAQGKCPHQSGVLRYEIRNQVVLNSRSASTLPRQCLNLFG